MKLTAHQEVAFNRIKAFVNDPEKRVFVLKGYAGTGKTTLARFIVEWLDNSQNGWRAMLLASTGRAARILSTKTGWETDTVHGHIYRFDVLEEEGAPYAEEETGQLTLVFGLKTSTATGRVLYIVDEASMISHLPSAGFHVAKFGSGVLLDDLFEFAGGENKILFIGDPAQLPPVVEKGAFSPALFAEFLQKRYGVVAEEAELTEVLRQKEGHAILELATGIRNCLMRKEFGDWEAMMRYEGQGIFRPFTQQIMIKRYLERVRHGYDKAVILTHSNKQAYYLNITMRKILQGGYKPFPEVGEVLLVTQNSYYVPLANGDQVILRSVEKGGIRKGIKFLKVTVEAVHNGEVYETLMIQDFLFNEAPNLSPDDSRKLLIDFDQRARKAGLKRNSEPYQDAMRQDPFLNALRAKFGYAVTCHKAQGGEWPHCFINLSDTLNMLDPETRYRWLYTAVSRAQQFLDIKPVYKGNVPRRQASRW